MAGDAVDIGADGVVARRAGDGITHAVGHGAPTSGWAGFAKGGQYTDMTNAVVYLNNGTSSSATWIADTIGSTIAADTISEFTAGSGVTVDGVLLKDQFATVSGLKSFEDATTYITDDEQPGQWRIYISGAVDFQFTANTFTALSGSSIQTNTISETTAANGVVVDSAVIRDGMFLGAQVTPTAETGVATITIADILTGLVTITHATGSDVALTLDTGTAMDTGKPSALGTNGYIDWTVINLSAAAADTATVTAASGHTVVGVMVVQSAHATTGGLYGNAARFRSRRTAANTWVTYRLA